MVNGPVGKLVQDFRCTKASDMNYPELAEQVRYLKETKEGRDKMCKVMQDWVDEELIDDKIQIIKNLMNNYNFSFEDAFGAANVTSRIAPAILKAFGVQPAQA